MPFYDVNIYPVFNVKLLKVEASDTKEALARALGMTSFASAQVTDVDSECEVDYTEYADENLYYLVRDHIPPEVGEEPEKLHEQWFDSNQIEML